MSAPINLSLPMYGGAWRVDVVEDGAHVRITKRPTTGDERNKREAQSQVYVDKQVFFQILGFFEKLRRAEELEAELAPLRVALRAVAP